MFLGISYNAHSFLCFVICSFITILLPLLYILLVRKKNIGRFHKLLVWGYCRTGRTGGYTNVHMYGMCFIVLCCRCMWYTY